MARAIPCCPEPGLHTALPRPPLKNKTDLAFRGFCIKAGRMRILWSMKWFDGFSTPKTCRKALVRVTSSIHSSDVNCLVFPGRGGLQPAFRLVPCYCHEPVLSGGLGLHLLHTPSFSYFLLGPRCYDCTSCLIFYVHCPSLFPLSLSFAGQGEKGDAGIKVGMRNKVF